MRDAAKIEAKLLV